MRLLDLYCGAGGAAVGYHQAGFTDIVGVDINPQPNYPFAFVQADVLNFMGRLTPGDARHQFDLIHASPPCQAHSTLRHSPGAGSYEDLIPATRQLLQESGVPYVIENVPGAPLDNPVTLCGSSVNLTYEGYELRRHRLFETNFPLLVPPCQHKGMVLGVYGDLAAHKRKSTRGWKAGRQDAQQLMGIDWMNDQELVQAIPPAYTKHIGEAFIQQVSHAR